MSTTDHGGTTMHSTKRAVALAAAFVAATVALTGTSTSAQPRVPSTERVTRSATGEQGNGDSYGPQLSADGRFAAFTADASNLVPGDTNSASDVFVRDLRNGTVERVSVSSAGTQADRESSVQAISADGRYVLFGSTARNLVPWDTPPADAGATDIYLHDRRTGSTQRISVGFDGGSAYAAGADLSANARYIAFNAKASRMEEGARDLFGAVYVFDRRTGTTQRVSNPDRPTNPALFQDVSDDGRYVLYTQFVPRSSNGVTWVHDRRTGTEERVNVKADGSPAQRYAMPATLSADGRTVAFQNWDEDLVPGGGPDASDLYVRDLRGDITRRVDTGPGGETMPDRPVISADGRYVGYEATPRLPDGTLGPANVYLRDLRTGSTRLISESVTGGPVTDTYVRLTTVSAGAKRIGLGSASAQLVAGDTNGADDGFVRHVR
ncbi:TolB family protein [Streptomyces sp. NPDC049627]|uniref:TolB family protein n=1 Tax=Streptomyces sp. NPDC049627 TaxID=3365595 RepID=UPI00378EF230